MAELGTVIDTIREAETPSDDERAELESVATDLVDRVEQELDTRALSATVTRVGSSARDTWLRGDRDIDIFLEIPTELDRDDLEQIGRTVGTAVIPDGTLEYAEHPYVSGTIDGYDIDIVPCYAVEDPANIRSAVDRTPFHAAYIRDRLTPALATDVRVLKRFCSAIGIYGSDLRTRGFSGYLTELLVLAYDGVEGLLRDVPSWTPPVRFDPEDHGQMEFQDPLVVIDPTDPNRNVASVVTADAVARFQHHTRELVADPDTACFEATATKPLDEATFRRHVTDRGTHPVAIRIDPPDIVDDQLYPQLRTTLNGITRLLESHGFNVLRGTIDRVDTALVYLELESATLPAVERHEGPPVHVSEHADAFLDQWSNATCYGPFIDENRYVIERFRTVRRPNQLLDTDRVFEAKLGADLEELLRTEYTYLDGTDVTALLPEFNETLGAFYDPIP